MALTDGLQLIKKQMQEHLERLDEPDPEGPRSTRKALGSWIDMLTLVCLVDEKPASTPPTNSAGAAYLQSHGCNPQGPARAAAQRAALKNDAGPRQAFVQGGPGDDTCTTIPGDMPLGAKLMLLGGVYRLGEDGQLHYSERDTQEVRELGKGRT